MYLNGTQQIRFLSSLIGVKTLNNPPLYKGHNVADFATMSEYPCHKTWTSNNNSGIKNIHEFTSAFGIYTPKFRAEFRHWFCSFLYIIKSISKAYVQTFVQALLDWHLNENSFKFKQISKNPTISVHQISLILIVAALTCFTWTFVKFPLQFSVFL